MRFSTILTTFLASVYSLPTCTSNGFSFSNFPSTVQRGNGIDTSVTGPLATALTTGSSVSAKLYLGNIAVYSSSHDFCTSVTGGCPTTNGNPVNLGLSEYIPTSAPKGSFTFVYRVKDSSNTEVFCLQHSLSVTA